MSIIEKKSIQSLFEDLDDQTLLVLDLDNTLLECATNYGSYQWAAYLIKKAVKEGMPLDQALDEIVPVWEETQEIVRMAPIEKDSALWIQRALKQNKCVIALTGRSPSLSARTRYELKEHQIHFSKLPFTKGVFSKGEYSIEYQDGVLFAGPKNSKGDVIVHFIKQVEPTFKKVILVDDQMRYLQQTQEAVESYGLEFLGIHFSVLNDKIDDFDLEQALEEQKLFERV